MQDKGGRNPSHDSRFKIKVNLLRRYLFVNAVDDNNESMEKWSPSKVSGPGTVEDKLTARDSDLEGVYHCVFNDY